MHDLVNSVRPKVVVVELGTNGCQNCASLPRAIDQDMQSLRGVPHVLWLTVNTEGPRAARGKVVNAALQDATKRWPNLELLRYDEWMKGRTDLVPATDVHPTAAGNVAIAKHLDAALQTRSQGWARNHGALLVALVVVLAAYPLVRKKSSR
jgi:lysophospholipase L1-like esterase